AATPVLRRGAQPLTAAQATRWVALLHQAADEAGLPADPAFRSAWSSCIEWLSRSAVQAGHATAATMPRWDWGLGGPPAPALQEPDKDSGGPAALPRSREPVSFAAPIKPLVRPHDPQSVI